MPSLNFNSEAGIGPWGAHKIMSRISAEETFRRFEYVLNHFRARQTDVIIASTPKSGTTWVQQILHQMRTGGSGEFGNINDVIAWLDTPNVDDSAEELLAQYDKMTEPRIFKTHCVYETTPGVAVARVIVISRDPRDCCVSRYYHGLNTRNAGIAFNEHFDQWMKVLEWFRHVASWWRRRDDANLLWLRYEEMTGDRPTNLNRISRFLGWSLSEEERAKVLRKSSFDWMKAHAERFIPHPMQHPAEFIRTGTVGSYRELMTAEQSQAVLRIAHRLLEPEIGRAHV